MRRQTNSSRRHGEKTGIAAGLVPARMGDCRQARASGQNHVHSASRMPYVSPRGAASARWIAQSYCGGRHSRFLSIHRVPKRQRRQTSAIIEQREPVYCTQRQQIQATYRRYSARSRRSGSRGLRARPLQPSFECHDAHKGRERSETHREGNGSHADESSNRRIWNNLEWARCSGVARGSHEPPKFIILEYRGERAKKNRAADRLGRQDGDV